MDVLESGLSTLKYFPWVSKGKEECTTLKTKNIFRKSQFWRHQTILYERKEFILSHNSLQLKLFICINVWVRG